MSLSRSEQPRPKAYLKKAVVMDAGLQIAVFSGSPGKIRRFL